MHFKNRIMNFRHAAALALVGWYSGLGWDSLLLKRRNWEK